MNQRVLLIDRGETLACSLTDLVEFEHAPSPAHGLARLRGGGFDAVLLSVDAEHDDDIAHFIRTAHEAQPSMPIFCMGDGPSVPWDRIARRTPLGSWQPLPAPCDAAATRSVIGCVLLARNAGAAAGGDSFLADASVALREPADEMLRLIDLTRGTTAANNEQRDALLAAAGRLGEQLTEMIDDLLDIAHLSSGRHSLESRICSPAVLLEHAATCARSALAANGRTLVMEVSDEVPETIETDPIRLGSLLMELVADAAEHPLGEHIHLYADWREGALQVHVTGATTEGQADRLAIARRFAQMLGGRLDIDHVGGWRFNLPVARQLTACAA